MLLLHLTRGLLTHQRILHNPDRAVALQSDETQPAFERRDCRRLTRAPNCPHPEPEFSGGKYLSEVPGRDQLEARYLKVSQIARRETSAVNFGDSGDHSIGRRHPPALSGRISHDVTIGQGCILCQPKDPVIESAAPIVQSIHQAIRAFIGPDFGNAEGDFSDGDGRKREFCIMLDEPGDNRRVRRFSQSFRDDVCIQENQSSIPAWWSRPSRITFSRSISVP